MSFKFSNSPLDTFTGKDKLYHAGGCFLITVFLLLVDLSVIQAVAVAGFIGLSKEVYDAKHSGGSGFSYKDLIADAVGIGLGLFFGVPLTV